MLAPAQTVPTLNWIDRIMVVNRGVIGDQGNRYMLISMVHSGYCPKTAPSSLRTILDPKSLSVRRTHGRIGDHLAGLGTSLELTQ